MNRSIQTFLWGIFIVVVVGALIYTFRGDGGEADVAGSQSGPQAVEILKYSDYSCPTCKQFIPLQEELKREFGDLVTIEYRHFPLGGFPHSGLASRTVEAAGEQGMKEEMHDLIFENQEQWSNSDAETIFAGYAEQLGLDMEQFRHDQQSEEIAVRVQQQRAEGERRMVSGTPTYFINGQRVQQLPRNYAQFRSIVEMHMYR